MKKMLVLITVCFAATFQKSSAQSGQQMNYYPSGFTYGFGSGLIYMPGDKAKNLKSGFGIGLDLQGEYGLGRVSLVGEAGFKFLTGKESEGIIADEKTAAVLQEDIKGYIPFFGGARFYLKPNIFIGAQVGYAMFQEGFLSGKTAGAVAYKPSVGFRGDKVQMAVWYNIQKIDNVNTSVIGITILKQQ